MSADEIRRLAEPLCLDRAVSVYNKSLDEFVADGCITLKYRDALLAYAAMVERADALIAKAKRVNETQMNFGCHSCVENYIKEIDYMLRGDAGKKEQK